MHHHRTVVGFVLLALVFAAPLAADEWYSLDGFTVVTADDVWIDAPFGAESEVIEFLFGDSLEPAVRGTLIEASGWGSAQNRALLEIVSQVAAQLRRDDVIRGIETEPFVGLPGVTAWAVEVSTASVRWFGVVIEIGETPGGFVSHLALVATEPGDAEDSLGRLIESLRIIVESAAG